MSTRKLVIVFTLLFAASLAVWSARAHEGEHHSPGGNGQPNDAPLAAMVNTPCVNGFAGTFPCNKVDLAALLPIADIDGTNAAGVTGNDIWGWTDPLTDKEYALLGLSNGVAFVDVTIPTAPVYLGNLPRHASDSLWRSMKVYRNHLFVVSEAVDHGMQVFDLTQLRNVASPPQTFSATAHYDNFSRAHTIAVNEETGFAYVAGSRPAAGRTPGVDTCSDLVQNPSTGRLMGRGLHVVDIRNPAAPVFAGCVDDDGYTHETQCVIYRGPDAQHQGREVCFSANEDTVTIVDVTNKAAPVQLSRTPYEGSGYTHQGWLTGDQTRFLVNDELDEQNFQLSKNRTFVWDVSNLDAPSVRGIFEGSTGSIDHNLYVRGLFAFESNYRSGVRVIDVRGAATANLSEVAFFDVYPVDDQAFFNGTWGNYPFFASGTIIASGLEQGLFVLRPQVGLPVRIDYEPFFVRQQYRDFLNREPDEPGLGFWTHEIEQCMADAQCREVKRVNVSAAFFLSIECQETGYLVYRMHRSSFGTPPAFAGFTNDARQVGQDVVVGRSGWEQQLAANKAAFAEAWVQRPAFLAEFSAGMDAQAYVTKLFQHAGVNPAPAEVQTAVNAYGTGNTQGRALALRSVVEGTTITQAHKSPAFVLMEYFGYLRRDPDEVGYNFWLDKLNDFNGNFVEAEMVKAFITAAEYRQRFGQ
jgi:choice-of-anchor B domain-containing protein